MRLYRVSVEVELVVAAKDTLDAERQAERLVEVEDGGAEVCALATLLGPSSPLPIGWCKDTIPFGSEDDRTIGEYFPAQAPSKEGKP